MVRRLLYVVGKVVLALKGWKPLLCKWHVRSKWGNYTVYAVTRDVRGYNLPHKHLQSFYTTRAGFDQYIAISLFTSKDYMVNLIAGMQCALLTLERGAGMIATHAAALLHCPCSTSHCSAGSTHSTCSRDQIKLGHQGRHKPSRDHGHFTFSHSTEIVLDNQDKYTESRRGSLILISEPQLTIFQSLLKLKHHLPFFFKTEGLKMCY